MANSRAVNLLMLAFFICAIGRESLAKSVFDGKSPSTLSDNRQQHPLHSRVPREIRKLKVRDPLDCLSQVVCGLNTYPPQRPSVRSSIANDFAFILKSSIEKLRSQKIFTTTTTTTPATTTRRTTPKTQVNDDDDDDEEYDEEDSIENELDYNDANGPAEYDNDYHHSRNPPPIPIDRRRLKRSSIFNERRGAVSKKKNSKNGKARSKNKKKLKKVLKAGENQRHRQRPPPKIFAKPTLSPLDRLRMETDLRAKLLSDAQCVNGLIDHTCPFNYQQMLSLISSSLEREKTVSYTTNKVLPMVGYLIKSRNYTGTLAATFTALEKINNYTLEADREGKPVDFSHILDEIMNRVTGDNGLRIVDTSNDSASASVWEDDEFDHVLENPYVRKRPSSDNYKLDKKKKEAEKKRQQEFAAAAAAAAAANDDQSTTSEEDTSEEGLIFDRPRPPLRRPSSDQKPDNDSSSEEEDDHHSKVFDKAGKKKNFGLNQKENLDAPPVFGHIRKSAEDE